MSFAGHAASSSGCVARPREREIGLTGYAGPVQLYLPTGSYVMETAEHREPYELRGSRTVVCPVKAGMFSRDQSCRGKSQRPRSLDSRVAGNQDPEAYRQGLPWGDYEPSGRNDSERKCGLESEKIRRPSPQPWGEGSMASRILTDTASSLRRGGSDSTVARTCQATGEALLVPVRNHRSKVDRITGSPGKSIEGERVADGSVLAVKPSNVGGAKGPCCL